MTVALSISGLKGLATRLEGICDALDKQGLKDAMRPLVREAVGEIKTRTPSMDPQEEADRPERKLHLAEKWRMDEDDNGFDVIHEFSEPSHEKHHILADLEFGTEPHVIGPVFTDMMTWIDTPRSEKWNREYGWRAWTKGNRVFIDPDKLPYIVHPGNRPYNMIKDTAESLVGKTRRAMGSYLKEVVK